MSLDNRDASRKLLRCPAFVLVPGGTPVRTRTVDVSLGGVGLLMPEPMKAGQACVIGIEPLLNGKPVRITANAKVAYSILSGADGFRIGLQITQIDEVNKKALTDLIG